VAACSRRLCSTTSAWRAPPSTSISRINKYGHDPDCINLKHPLLVKWCICRYPTAHSRVIGVALSHADIVQKQMTVLREPPTKMTRTAYLQRHGMIAMLCRNALEKLRYSHMCADIAGRPAGARKMSITDYVLYEARKDVPKLIFEVRRSVFSCSDAAEVLHG